MGSRINLENLVALDQVHIKDQFFFGEPWQKLGKPLTKWLDTLLTSLGVGETPKILGKVSPHAVIEGKVYVAPGAQVDPHCFITGPCYIGPDAEVRHGAYIRGSVFVGARAVVGHTTEVKGSIFFDDAKAGHFAYVGDAILGRHVNLGAGTKLANLKISNDEVKVRDPDKPQRIPTGLRKMGAVMGDYSQTGCNAVLSPGTILLPKTFVLPCAHFVGTKAD